MQEFLQSSLTGVNKVNPRHSAVLISPPSQLRVEWSTSHSHRESNNTRIYPTTKKQPSSQSGRGCGHYPRWNSPETVEGSLSLEQRPEPRQSVEWRLFRREVGRNPQVPNAPSHEDADQSRGRTQEFNDESDKTSVHRSRPTHHVIVVWCGRFGMDRLLSRHRLGLVYCTS